VTFFNLILIIVQKVEQKTTGEEKTNVIFNIAMWKHMCVRCFPMRKSLLLKKLLPPWFMTQAVPFFDVFSSISASVEV